MKIGILGTGMIGKLLVQKLSAAGHEVKVANSRGPETIDQSILTNGAKAVNTAEALKDVDTVIISIPLNAIPKIAPQIHNLPDDVAIIDTSNYYPQRDEAIPAINKGEVESVWVKEQLKRPFAKAWNSIFFLSLKNAGLPYGTPGRIALPVSGDRDVDVSAALRLVEDTGFDAVFVGKLADSWRQQPGAPCYCTDLDAKQLKEALDKAQKDILPDRRDQSVKKIIEMTSGNGSEAGKLPTEEELNNSWQEMIKMTREVNMQ